MKVSVVMPVFNAGRFLPIAVESVANNRCSGVNIELILVDDCSTDVLTQELLAGMEGSDWIKVVRHQQNGGPAKARNTALRHATGEWISFLDADDMMAPGTMAMRLALLEKHPNLDWLASDMLEMRKEGELTHRHNFSVNPACGEEIEPGVILIRNTLRELARWSTLPSLGTMLLRRTILDKVGGLDESLTYGEDVHFCLLVSSYAELAWVHEPWLHVRRHHESMTKDKLRLAQESPRHTARLLQDARMRPIRKELRWHHAAELRQLARVALSRNLRGMALVAALKSLRWTPNSSAGVRLVLQACLGTGPRA